MNASTEGAPQTFENGGDFYSRAGGRISKFMLVVGAAAMITAFSCFGWRIGIGFLLGAAISWLNFHWLKQVVEGIAELTIRSGRAASSRGVFHRFVVRYFLMALVAFAILTVSRESLYGLFAGLFLPVAAILCEGAYEVYVVVGGREHSL
ncbi:MAG: ATP synthase subunit I [Acidobacteria bacterium]|nr:ATP synthase subunit I [Acidobacteriota bacterium]